uniref:GIY-YIG endonuclease n=1 Tax=Morchella brunnea TaxID=1174671 RepID=A0A8K1I886_9PEZI|nr:GIY-YIG endonuclease [Morchella brunnea]UBU98542.1 GIY-YIG endonuclease [Morchella brunnea]
MEKDYKIVNILALSIKRRARVARPLQPPQMRGAAIIKYGHSNFTLEILEYCEPSNAVAREQHYIDILKPQYNILQTAGSPLGRKHSEEAKASPRRGDAASRLGRLHSE